MLMPVTGSVYIVIGEHFFDNVLANDFLYPIAPPEHPQQAQEYGQAQKVVNATPNGHTALPDEATARFDVSEIGLIFCFIHDSKPDGSSLRDASKSFPESPMNRG